MDLLSAVEGFLKEYYDACGRLDMGTEKVGDILPTVLEKAGKNLKFREKILNAPVEVLAKEGFKLPKGFNLKFVEQTENTVILPLLPFVGAGYPINKKDKFSELDEIIQQANTDIDFRHRLIESPKSLLLEKGFRIDQKTTVKVLESTDDVFYVVLPAIETPGSKGTQSIELVIEGDTLHLSGRLDGTSVETVRDTFLNWEGNLNLDLRRLDYISSAGLSLLLMTSKRLKESSHEIKLLNLKPMVRNVIVLAGFETIFNLGSN
jgi:anti-anti-sigma factor